MLRAAVKKYSSELLWTCIEELESETNCGHYESHKDEQNAYFLELWKDDYTGSYTGRAILDRGAEFSAANYWDTDWMNPKLWSDNGFS